MIKLIAIAIFALCLSNCTIMRSDCGDLRDNPDEYRMCMANQGSPDFQYEIAMEAYAEEDYNTAIRWLKRAAVPKYQSVPRYAEFDAPRRGSIAALNARKPFPGHRGAQRLLAKIYGEGIGVDVDEKKQQQYLDMMAARP